MIAVLCPLHPSDSDVNAAPGHSRRANCALTLPNPLLAPARDRVRARRAVAQRACHPGPEEMLARDRLQEVVDQVAAEYGPLTPEDPGYGFVYRPRTLGTCR